MANPTVKERPELKTAPPAEAPTAPREIRVRPPQRRKRGVRWIEYAAVLIIVGAAAAIAVIMAGEETTTPLDVDAASVAVIGERHTDPDFAIEPRWIGESGLTLEQFEAQFDPFASLYEAESGPSYGARHTDPDFEVATRFVGESDMTLEEYELYSR